MFLVPGLRDRSLSCSLYFLKLKGSPYDGHSLFPKTFERKQLTKIPAVESPRPSLAQIPSEAGALGGMGKIEDQRAKAMW